MQTTRFLLLPLLFSFGCGQSSKTQLTVNVFNVKSELHARALSSPSCLQNTIALVARNSDTGEELVRQQVLLRTALSPSTTLFGNFSTDVDHVTSFLADPNRAFLDQPLQIAIPTSGSIEIRVFGVFADPHDVLSSNDTVAGADQICDQIDTSGAGRSAAAIYGHTLVTAAALKAGAIDVSLNILDANSSTGNYTTALSTGAIASHADWVELPISMPVAGNLNFQTSGYHTCAVLNGGASCWGWNSHGQLGNGTTVDSSTPVTVTGLSSGVTAISEGTYDSCAIVNGGAKRWGFNISGELGNNSTTQSSVPVQVSGLASGVQAISVGVEVACAVVNGSALCWGLNANGQLGNGTTTNASIPTQVTGMSSGVAAISTNTFTTCAIKNSAAWCWGYGSGGNLGNGSANSSLTPVLVSGIPTAVQQISVSDDHACVISSGAVYCWGLNLYGQVGTPNVSYPTTALLVQGLPNPVQQVYTSTISNIDANPPHPHSCALAGGAVYCWGGNDIGQLGNGNMIATATPTLVTGLESGVTALSVNQRTNCALQYGSLTCWGSNTEGEFGNGTTTSSTSIVTIPQIYSYGGNLSVIGASTGALKINFGASAANASYFYLPNVFPYTLQLALTSTGDNSLCTSGGASCTGRFEALVSAPGQIKMVKKISTDTGPAPATIYTAGSNALQIY